MHAACVLPGEWTLQGGRGHLQVSESAVEASWCPGWCRSLARPHRLEASS